MRKIGEFLLARTGHAALVAFLFTLSPLVGIPGGFVASIIVGFVTLCRGPRSGLFVLAWVAMPAVVLLYLQRFGISDILLLRCVLIWLLAYVLRRLDSWCRVFETAALLSALVVIGMHLAMPNLGAWWASHLTKYIAEVNSLSSWRLTATQSDHLIKSVVPMATGIVAFIVLFGSWLVLMLSRWWQTSIYYPGRLREEFIGIRNRISMAIVLVLGAVGVVLKQAIVVDLFPILLFLFMMGGLSFLHYVASIAKGFVFVVVLMYLGILFLPLIVVVLLAFIGFLDTWINFRKFIKIKGEVA